MSALAACLSIFALGSPARAEEPAQDPLAARKFTDPMIGKTWFYVGTISDEANPGAACAAMGHRAPTLTEAALARSFLFASPVGELALSELSSLKYMVVVDEDGEVKHMRAGDGYLTGFGDLVVALFCVID